MKIRAKFSCTQVTKTAYGSEIVKLSAFTSGTPEDNSFAKATPSAQLEMTIDNISAQGFFTPGKNFYADFTVAP